MTRILYADDLPAVFGHLSIIYEEEKMDSCKRQVLPWAKFSSPGPKRFW